MAEYVIAFDDSGGDTRFKDGMIAPAPSAEQAACIAGVMIRKDRYPSFRERWQELCAEIAQELGVQSVHIHLNQMYGRSLHTEHKGICKSRWNSEIAIRENSPIPAAGRENLSKLCE